MDSDEVDRIRAEIWRLVLAVHDMRLVASAAQVLMDDGGDLVLEAGLVAIYCRSFSRAPAVDGERPCRHIVDEFAPEQELHDRLWRLRNKGVGHTDADYEHRREAVDVFGTHEHDVEYAHLNPNLLMPIRALALALEAQLREAQEWHEQLLRDAEIDPRPHFTS